MPMTMVVIKYFENTDQYSKLIPRPMQLFLKMKGKPPGKNDVSGEQIRRLIEKDDPFLQKINPIQSISHYDNDEFRSVQDTDVFHVVEGEETLITFHVKRDIMVDKLHVQSTMTFSDVSSAERWLLMAIQSQQGQNSAIHFRYFDIFHHGFTMTKKNGSIPKGRTGSHVKLMIEKPMPERQLQDTLAAYKSGKIMPEKSLEGFQDDEDSSDEVSSESSSSIGPSTPTNIGSDWLIVSNDDLTMKTYGSFVSLEKLKFPNSYGEVEKRRLMKWKNVSTPKNKKAVSRKLKKLIRKGIAEGRRREVYLGITSANEVLKHDKNVYLNLLKKLFSNYHINQEVDLKNVNPRMHPEFGGKLVIEDGTFITDNGVRAAKRLLCALAEQHKDIECCPSLPEFVKYLLVIMDEEPAFALASAMLSISKKTNWYFRCNRMQVALYKESFNNLVRKFLPVIFNHMKTIDFDLSVIASWWFDRLFVTYLPFPMVIRLMDAFINEGGKILYRAGFAILSLLQTEILKCKSSQYLNVLLCEKSLLLKETEFFRTMYKLRLKRKQMMSADQQSRNSIDLTKLGGKLSLYAKPKLKCESEILKGMAYWEQIVQWLPFSCRIREIHKLYSSDLHGYSLHNLVSRCKDSGPMLLVLKVKPIYSDLFVDDIEEEGEVDIVELIKRKKKQGKSLRKEIRQKEIKIQEDKEAFEKNIVTQVIPRNVQKQIKEKPEYCILGAFLGESIEITHRYSGTTDTFLFSLYPVEARYRWSRKNDYFILGQNKQLSFGAEGDGPGLKFDDDLNHGESNHCETFDNDPLCGSTNKFKILKVECFHFK